MSEAHDLLYLYERESMDKASEAIKAAFPAAKLEEDWDDVHRWRLQVTLDGVSQDDWAVWILKEGLGTLSLTIQMTLYQDTAKVKGWLEKAGIATDAPAAA